jgi:hypothetical protein
MLYILKRYYAVMIMMALFGFVFRAVVFFDEMPLYINAVVTVGSIGALWVLWAFFYGLNVYLNQTMPYENNLIKRLSLQIGLGLLMSYAFVNTLFFVNFYFYKFLKIDKIIVVAGNMMWTLIVLAINGFFIGEYFFYKWKQALTRSIEVERDLAQVQFLNLQNQLNPHFLFNSLTTLNSLIHENPHRASTFLKQLAHIYRYVMQHNQDALVSLSDELAFLQHYLDLLSTRFENAFSCQITVGEEQATRKIVPVTLQILIENAVKHNQMSEENPLAVQVYIEGAYICVKNLKRLKKNLTTSNKIGLSNLRKLYKVTAPQSEVFIEDSLAHFIVKVPLL